MEPPISFFSVFGPGVSGGLFAGTASGNVPKTGTVTLTAANWTGSGPYTQTVTVTGAAVTAKSKVDLQPSAAQLAALIADGVGALLVENNAGTLTAYALGAAPSAAMTMQCTVEETA